MRFLRYGTRKNTLHNIYKAVATKWPARGVGSNFMLGVKKRAGIAPNGNSLAMTMGAYATSTAEAVKDHHRC